MEPQKQTLRDRFKQNILTMFAMNSLSSAPADMRGDYRRALGIDKATNTPLWMKKRRNRRRNRAARIARRHNRLS